MSLNKEKLESELFQQYQTGIDLLEKGQIEEGKEILKKLLENPAVINQDDKKILYGVYRSLAELLALSQDVQGKCEALQYYYQSTLISENCWQTYRKMAIIFRQLGMMPRALNLMLKSLQQNKQQNLNQPIIYQICCICFLMNDKDQFIKYYMMMKDNINLKLLLSELNNYFINGNQTEFVEKLLLEKSQIPHKLQQIPQNQLQQEFFNQQFDYELKIDTYDLKKFFKKIKNILQINVNVEPKKSDFINKEKCYLTNTKIMILSKQSFQKKKNVQKEQPKESQQPVKQSERQRSKKSKQQQDQQFVLDNYIHQSHSRLIDLIKNIEGSEVFSHPTGNNVKIQTETNEKQESQVAKYLLESFNNKIFLTIIQVIEKIIILLFNQKSQQNFPEQDYKMALKGLINCIVWAQYSTNKFTDDPIIKLNLLEVAYEELNQRFKEKKPKSPDQQIKIKNYIKFINDLKLELLQINIKEYIQDEQEIQNYFKNFYTLMAYIHSDINFFQGRIAKQCLQQLHDSELEKRVMEKIQASKIQISSNSPHQSQQINQILQQWEQKEQKLEENDKIRTQINHVLEYLTQNQSCEMIKRLATICLNQFYFVQQKEELKGIYKFVQPLIQQFLEIQQPDIQLAFIFLKFAIIQSFTEQDPSDILVKFFGPFMQTIKCDKKHIIILEILRLNHLNYQKLFSSINLDVLLQQFIDARLSMKQYFQSNTDYFKMNLQGDPELNYYLISQLDLLPNHTPKYIAQQNTLQIEVDKIETKLQQPDTFSEASEEEFEFNQQFTQQYVQIGLSSDQIESQFSILGHHYQFSNKQIDFLQNHTLKINLGDPDILDHIKRLGKETIKIRFGLSTKELSNNLNFIFLKNYYLQPNFDKTLTQTEIQFMGYFLPHLQKDLQDSKQFSQFLLVNVKNILIQSIEPEVQEYQDQLFNYIFSKQTKQTNNLKDLQEQIIKLNLQCDYKSNLFYLIQKEEELQETEAQQQQQQNYRSICYALAYKDSAFLWNHLYLTIFERAENQFTSKQQSEIDWFLGQKKIQAMVNKNPQLNYLFEYRYIMDLLKAQQRQNEYQYGQNEKLFQKTQQAYQCLFQKSFNIPNNIYQIEHNFRVLQLYEKKVVRKYRILSIQNIEQNINNLLSLKQLIIQMNQNDMNYFYQSKDGEIEINQDLHINIYKFIKRFIRHRLHGQLNQLIKLIQEKLPYLLEECENKLEFEFPYDNRKFKIPNLTIEQFNAEESVNYDQQKVNCILNQILLIFQENASKFSKKKVSRYVIEGVYYSTHLKYHSNSPIEQIYAQISSIYQPNSRDLVYYYKQIHKYKIEKDEVLSRYHNHDLMFNYLRQKLVKLILKILLKENKFKEIFSLFEKLHRCFDLRLYQACIGLLDVCNMIEDKILLRDIIMKAETYRKTIEIFKQDQVLKLVEDAYVRLYEKDQEDQNNKEYIQELRQTKIEKGQKIIEEFKATKRKPPKQKETQQSQQPIQSQVQQQEQIIQQQQEIITNNNNNNDDIEQYLNQGPILQNFNEDDNL